MRKKKKFVNSRRKNNAKKVWLKKQPRRPH
jgi:hypothetical protein